MYGGRDYMHTRMQVAPRYLNFLHEEPKHPPRILGSTQAKIRAAQKKAQQKAQRSRRATPNRKPERSDRHEQRITSKEVRDAFGTAGRENLMIFDLADAGGAMTITFDQVRFRTSAVCSLHAEGLPALFSSRLTFFVCWHPGLAR